MMTRSIACGACGADVPQGRLSCPACGELLASVSGAIRSSAPVAVAADERPLVDALLDDDPQPVASAAVAVAERPDPMLALDPDAQPTLGFDDDDDDLVDDVEPETAALFDDDELEPEPAAAPLDDVEPHAQTPSWAEAPAWSRSPEPPPVIPAAVPPPVLDPTPGAYRPPAVVAAPPSAPAAFGPTTSATATSGPAAPARAWGGASVVEAVVDPEPDPEAVAARARLAEMVGWLGIAGCALAMLGFLIPWARTVIGSSGTGYFDQWGVAGPWHILFVVALGAILAGVVIPNRIPAWLRLGIPGLIVGSLLLGLLWPYVLGPLGTLPGAFLTLAGSMTLLVAAVASLVTDRHGSPAPAV